MRTVVEGVSPSCRRWISPNSHCISKLIKLLLKRRIILISHFVVGINNGFDDRTKESERLVVDWRCKKETRRSKNKKSKELIFPSIRAEVEKDLHKNAGNHRNSKVLILTLDGRFEVNLFTSREGCWRRR
jgi:hypothetical protein